MKDNSILNKVRELLGMEVKLAERRLEDGQTRIEAEEFAAGFQVVIVTEDDQRIPMPEGEYKLDGEEGEILVIKEEGIIFEIKKEEVVEEEVVEEEVEVKKESPKFKPDFEVGEDVSEEVKLFDLGRRSILALRQNLISKIQEHDNTNIYKQFKDLEGEIYTAEVHHIRHRAVILLDDEGNELILPKDKQIPSDFFRKGDTSYSCSTPIYQYECR